MSDVTGPGAVPHPDLGGYVLGILSPEEEEAFGTLLERDPELRRQLAELAALPKMLALAGDVDGDGEDDLAVPPAVAPVVPFTAPAAAAARQGPAVAGGERRRFGAGAVAAVAVAAALVAALPATIVASRSGSGGPAIEQELALGPGKAPIAGASGTAELFSEGNGVGVQLELEGLTSTGEGERYECWWVGKAGRVSAGSFQVGPDGTADVRLTVAAELGDGFVLNINRVSGETETNVLTVAT